MTPANPRKSRMTAASPSPAPPTPAIPLDDVVKHFAHLAAESGVILTHLKLQALCYYAQIFHWSRFNTPLFADPVEAWPGTPTIPDLWYRYGQWEGEAVPFASVARLAAQPARAALLDEIFARYGRLYVVELMNLAWFGPWHDLDTDARAEIPDDVLAAHGRSLDRIFPPGPPPPDDADGIAPDVLERTRNEVLAGEPAEA